ncbi:hypothetical protein N9174_02650, partial [bacterium]|nr:hypothetical protein [bacterium]
HSRKLFNGHYLKWIYFDSDIFLKSKLQSGIKFARSYRRNPGGATTGSKVVTPPEGTSGWSIL